MIQFQENYKIAMHAAVEASEKILEIYQTPFGSQTKEDGSPVTHADLLSSKIITHHLEKTTIPIISEEQVNLSFEKRQHWEKNWCVDPLDGTKEFIKKNGEFAINIALVEHEQPIFGLIAEPCKGQMIVGGKDLGVFLWHYIQDSEMKNFIPVKNSMILSNSVVWIGSRSHPHSDKNWIGELEHEFDSVEKISKGSAIKFFDLAQEKAQIYPRFAPTMEWDIAAGHAILRELGGTIVSTETGEELRYNKESLFNPHFVAKTHTFLQREKKFSTLRSI